MIISEKQIMQLINVAHAILTIDFVPEIYKERVKSLLTVIESQQSNELKEIK